MRFSYSNVSTFAQCPFRWYLQYRQRLKTIPNTDAGNALWLGLALHKGIETGSVEAALEEYKSHYNVITDENINWCIQLEYQLPRVLDILPPGGEHEIEVKTDDYVGYIDYVEGDTIWDFKFSNNVDNYITSPQLSIYKHYLRRVRPELEINHLKFVFVPKVNIRQKFKARPPETLFEFRERLMEELAATKIQVVEVDFNENSVTDFQDCCKFITSCTEFPKQPSPLCGWCQYKQYCESDGEIDWMIQK
jgi:hypothetical protein